MQGFTVQIEALGELIDNLETAAERITEANKQLGAHSVLGALGNETLAQAGTRFEEAWEYGISKLGAAAEQVVDGLVEARQAYQHVDEMQEELLRRTAEGLTAPSATPGEPGNPAANGGGGSDPSGGIVAGGYVGGIQDRLAGR